MSTQVYASREASRPGGFLRDLIRSRDLLLQLVLKDLRVRYRYTAAGVVWAMLEPLALMMVLSFVFAYVLAGRIGWGGDPNIPYSIFLLTGLIFWQFTASSLNAAANALLDNRNLVKKVRFVREVLPLAALGYPLINLSIGMGILLVLHLILGGALTLSVLWVPVIFAIQFALTAGLALLLSCGNVHYRDVGYILAVALLLGFYATPIIYPASLVAEAPVPGWVRAAYFVNPMAGIIEGYHGAILGLGVQPMLLLWPALAALITALLGVLVFRRLSPTLSDHL
jgi:lipopolysaccharide transport system permease protein